MQHNNIEQAKKFIDVEKILKDKNPSLYKILPSFIIKYLKKIVHQDFVNDFIATHGHKYNIDFAKQIIESFQAETQIIGKNNIPLLGGCIFVANHPLGGLDAMALVKEVGDVRSDIKFLVNDILMNLKNLSDIFIPVNKHGKNASDSLRQIDELYGSEKAILIFPAGLVSRKQNGFIKDLEWKKSFVAKAKKYNKPIIPVYIEGNNSNFFYNLSILRKKIGIKANIEMLYLVDEMYKQKGKKIKLIIGSKITPEQLTVIKSDFDAAQKIKEYVYLLKKDSALSFN